MSPDAFVLRFFGEESGDRLLIINLGRMLRFAPIPEPLLAPPREGQWEILWCSEDPKYRGPGCPPVRQTEGWFIPGHSAVVMYERTVGD